MYAIIETGGKQYKVEEGMKIRLEKFPDSEGSDVRIKEVLVVNNGENLLVGNPFVSGATVSGKVLGHGKARKVIVFKFKRRKDYKKKVGHRQQYTELLIEKIQMEESHGS